MPAFMRKNGKIPLKVAIVGYGYWGPNLLRIFHENEKSEVIICCDVDPKRLAIVRRKYPTIQTTTNFKDVISSKLVDAVVIATPLAYHFDLARKALLAGKHVWLEKPMTKTSLQAKELVKLARSKKKILQVDHIFLYTQAVTYLKKIMEKNELGDIYYFDSVRINLGLFQPDANVIWDLAIHDITIMSYLLGKNPKSVSASGDCHIKPDLQDTAHLNFKFDKETSAHINVSWLSPVKIRRMIIAGDKKMIVYDDLETSEKIKIYSHGVTINENYKPESTTSGYQYRTGDIYVPALENKEALQKACSHFIDCILKNKTPLTDGVAGLNCVRILEAASLSLKNGKEEKI